MAEDRSFLDRIFEGVNLGDYDPRERSGKDIFNFFINQSSVS